MAPGRTLAIRLTLNRCLQLRFSLMELLPQEPQPRVVVAERLLKKLPPLLVAVSYTHLDVYKRQASWTFRSTWSSASTTTPPCLL